MNRAIYYLLLIFMALFGIALIIFLTPTQQEYGDILLESSHYEESFEHYRRLYEKGDHSVPTGTSLAELYLSHAQISDAIRVLKELIEENPRNLKLRKWLGEIYKSANRPYLYLKNLEEIYAIEPTQQNLREQLILQIKYNNIDKQIKILEELLKPNNDQVAELENIQPPKKRYRPPQNEYYQLFVLYFSQGKYQEGLAVLDEMLEKWPTAELDQNILIKMIANLVDIQENKRALALAQDYLQTHPNIKIANDLFWIFADKGYPQEALGIIDFLPESEEENPLAISDKASLLLSLKKNHEAYELLKNAYQKQIFPTNLLGPYILLAIDRENEKQLERYITEKNISQIPALELVQIYEKASLLNKRHLISLITQKLSPSQQKNLFISTAVALVGHSENTVSKLDFRQLNNKEKVSLADLAYLERQSQLSKELILNVNSLQSLDESEINILVYIGLMQGNIDHIETLVEQERKFKQTSIHLDYVETLIAAAKGNLKQVTNWMNNHPKAPFQELSALYQLAYDTKHSIILLEVAKESDKRFNNVETKKMLAQAYISAKDEEAALIILDQMRSQGHPYTDLYLEALISAVKNGKLYNEKVQKALKEILVSNEIPKQRKRELAYSLAEAGHKKIAAKIFLSLSKDESFDQDDIQMVLYLWGEKLNKKQLNWIEVQAKTANRKDKIKWLRILLNHHQEATVERIVRSEGLDDPEIQLIYLETLAALKDKKTLESTLRHLFETEDDPKFLQKLAKIANENNFNTIAKEIYLKLQDQNYHLKETLRALSEIAYAENNWPETLYYWGNFITLFDGDYKAFFEYGEALFQYPCDKPLARCFFLYALYLIEEMPDPDFQALRTKARILALLNCLYQSIAQYEILLASHPEDISLRQEFASLLLEQEMLCYAIALLNSTPETIGKEGNEELLVNQQVLQALWYKAENCLCLAIHELNKLEHAFPENTSILAARADVENSVGHWQSALDYLEQAIVLSPNNESYRRAHWSIWRDHLPLINWEEELRQTGEFQEDCFSRLNYLHYLDQNTTFLFNLERDDLRLRQYIDYLAGDTTPSTFNGQRYRGTALASAYFTDNFIGRAAIFAGNRVIGSGAGFTYFDLLGFSHFDLEYHRPYWDVVTSVIEYGSRDRIFIGRHHKFSQQLEIGIDPAYNQYNIPHDTGAARSWTVEGFISYRMPRYWKVVRAFGAEADLYLQYILSAEYPFYVETEIASDGTEFQVLPISRTELHSLLFVINKRFSCNLRMEGYIGTTYDRFGSSPPPPVGRIMLMYGTHPGNELYIEYSHIVSSQQTNEMADRLIMGLRYSF